MSSVWYVGKQRSVKLERRGEKLQILISGAKFCGEVIPGADVYVPADWLVEYADQVRGELGKLRSSNEDYSI